MRREKGKLSISKKTFFTLALAGLLTLSGCGSSGSSSYSTHRSDDSYGAKSSKMMSGAGYTNSVDSVAGADDSYYEESYESYDEVAEADVETESTSDVTDKENTTNKIDTEKLIYEIAEYE